MTWVPIQESGLLYEDFFLQNGAIVEDSIVKAVNLEPSFDGTLFFFGFQSGSSFQSNLDLGWSGRVRMTALSYHAVSPGAGQPFEASELAQRASGDALVSRVVNEQPPYPDLEWTDDDVTSFTPNVFIGDVLPEMTYLDGNWIGPVQSFNMRTVTMPTISYEVLVEVEMDAVPSGFWTNFINVRES